MPMYYNKNVKFVIEIYSIFVVDSDATVKSTLENKLTEFKEKNGLILVDDTKKKKLTEKEQEEALGGLSNLFIQAAVLSAIALKKSSIPGIYVPLYPLV